MEPLPKLSGDSLAVGGGGCYLATPTLPGSTHPQHMLCLAFPRVTHRRGNVHPRTKLSPIPAQSVWKNPCPWKLESELFSQPWGQEGSLHVTTVSLFLCKKFV